MKINFKQPKYVLPLLALPFLCLFFYAWQSGFSKAEPVLKPVVGLNGSVGSVSRDVQKKELADKLDAYRNTYKDADGYTAVNVIPKEASSNATFHDRYNNKEKKMLDSIAQAMKEKYNKQPVAGSDQALAGAINSVVHRSKRPVVAELRSDPDPMNVFRQQMSYIDSVGQLNDPDYKARLLKKKASDKAAVAAAAAAATSLRVVKANVEDQEFNTIKPASLNNMISAVIDENSTGYAGSRLRLKLLEDIRAGRDLVPKGSYLYALISGFSEQRVTLSITTITCGGKILPVKLDVYDLDGLPGLYVPSSAFRDFTKDLGGSAVQGVTLDGSSGSQFLMSSVSKVFQSTSSAIAELIRKNKAKMKYNSFIYLVDNEALQYGSKSGNENPGLSENSK